MFDMTQGVCKDEKDLDVFFPEDDGIYDRAKLRYAKFVCMGCPVRDLCRQEGVTNQLETIGVWGGLTEKERRRVARGTDKYTPSNGMLAWSKESNAKRAVDSAAVNMPYYVQVLEQQGPNLPAEFRRVLEARIANPTLTLSELANLLGVKKDNVAGRLTRAKQSAISGKKLSWESRKGIKLGPRKKSVLD